MAELPIPKYRTLWTWDYCTYWDESTFVRGKGAFGPNQRRARFLDDYERIVDFCAAHGLNGIVIWGALRAHDDGEQQLKTLARYGRERGVRILPGCGIFSYGGVYYDARANYNGFMDWQMPSNPYALHTWLRQHPEYRAIAADGQPYPTGPYSDIACPSRPETLRWFTDALQWLLSEFDVGGVQVEIGDYAVCHCELCKARRGQGENPVFDVADMIKPYTAAVEAARQVNPDAWVICESYSSFGVPAQPETPGFGTALTRAQLEMLSALPEQAIVQWVVDRAVGPKAVHRWAPDVYVPTRENIARIHTGSQWTARGPAEWGVPLIADLVNKARASGLNGVSIFGEESPAAPPNEANYLVFAEFLGQGKSNPTCDLALFYTQTLDPLYGGDGMAREWERIYLAGQDLRLALHAAGAVNVARSERQQAVQKLAEEAHAVSSRLSGETCRRWSWLEDWLWRAEWLTRTSKDS